MFLFLFFKCPWVHFIGWSLELRLGVDSWVGQLSFLFSSSCSIIHKVYKIATDLKCYFSVVICLLLIQTTKTNCYPPPHPNRAAGWNVSHAGNRLGGAIWGALLFGKNTVKKNTTLVSPLFSLLLFNHLYFLVLPMWLPVELEQIKLIFHKRLQK